MSDFIKLNDFVVYQKSVELADLSWNEYKQWNFSIRKIIGDQFIRATDSIAANIAEGYGRFHYLDKVRFYYNARGSLYEVQYWIDQLLKRKMISEEISLKLMNLHEQISYKLYKLIQSAYESKKGL